MTNDDKNVDQNCGKADAENDLKPDPKQKSSEVVCSLCSGDFFVLFIYARTQIISISTIKKRIKFTFKVCHIHLTKVKKKL